MTATFAASFALLAYIGPGAGIGMLGALAGVLLAVGGALLMALAWGPPPCTTTSLMLREYSRASWAAT